MRFDGTRGFVAENMMSLADISVPIKLPKLRQKKFTVLL
jgi:hypothetical protein